jgi:hypothetical protein
VFRDVLYGIVLHCHTGIGSQVCLELYSFVLVSSSSYALLYALCLMVCLCCLMYSRILRYLSSPHILFQQAIFAGNFRPDLALSVTSEQNAEFLN